MAERIMVEGETGLCMQDQLAAGVPIFFDILERQSRYLHVLKSVMLVLTVILVCFIIMSLIIYIFLLIAFSEEFTFLFSVRLRCMLIVDDCIVLFICRKHLHVKVYLYILVY